MEVPPTQINAKPVDPMKGKQLHDKPNCENAVKFLRIQREHRPAKSQQQKQPKPASNFAEYGPNSKLKRHPWKSKKLNLQSKRGSSENQDSIRSEKFSGE